MGEPADVVTRFFEALSSGEVQTAVALVAEGSDFRTPLGPLDGREAIERYLDSFDNAFPEASYRIDTMVESTATVAAEGIYVATHAGPLPLPDGSRLEPTGRTVSSPFVTMFRVVDGSIVSHRPYWDVTGFLAQLAG
jgi:steroid delta-isomerase-like uncharacterized protein